MGRVYVHLVRKQRLVKALRRSALRREGSIARLAYTLATRASPLADPVMQWKLAAAEIDADSGDLRLSLSELEREDQTAKP